MHTGETGTYEKDTHVNCNCLREWFSLMCPLVPPVSSHKGVKLCFQVLEVRELNGQKKTHETRCDACSETKCGNAQSGLCLATKQNSKQMRARRSTTWKIGDTNNGTCWHELLLELSVEN